MTGFGQSTAVVDDGSIHVEVKSLNSKFLDLGLKLPPDFSDKDIDIRNRVQEQMERGKIAVINLTNHLVRAQSLMTDED